MLFPSRTKYTRGQETVRGPKQLSGNLTPRVLLRHTYFLQQQQPPRHLLRLVQPWCHCVPCSGRAHDCRGVSLRTQQSWLLRCAALPEPRTCPGHKLPPFPTPQEKGMKAEGSQPPHPAPCPGRFSCPQVTRGAITVLRKGTAVKQP